MLEAVRGGGKYGVAIAGELDVDNIDNVNRAAWHVGIPCDPSQSLRLAAAIRGVTERRLLVREQDVGLVAAWLDLRRAVYSKLMTSELDYAGKAMLLAAATSACREGVITEDDWRYTDWEFTTRLLSSSCGEAKRPLQQWLLGEFWALTDIVWMSGPVPSLQRTFQFSEQVSATMGRCMAYRITDKRVRTVRLLLTNGREIRVGEDPTQWLFAVALDRRHLTRTENTAILRLAEQTFGAHITGSAGEHGTTTPGLF